ncbi:hypothetical protein FB451DRAFT_1372548 [Mycena latifolia]|nr:hypothetical protein FB451DRAFT_1372548 [Mycena latifolia]
MRQSQTRPRLLLSLSASMPSSSQSPPPAPRRRASASPSRDAGVKGITRKVIRTLEGLGHPVLSEADDEADDEHEVARALEADAERRAGKQRALHPSTGGPQKKIDWEIPRKVFHSSIGFITLGLYLTPSMSPRTVALTLWAALAVIGPTDFVRLRVPAVERVYERALGFLMRESERHGTNGTLWYILGVNFALTFYPIDVATVAILIVRAAPERQPGSCATHRPLLPSLPWAGLPPPDRGGSPRVGARARSPVVLAYSVPARTRRLALGCPRVLVGSHSAPGGVVSSVRSVLGGETWLAGLRLWTPLAGLRVRRPTPARRRVPNSVSPRPLRREGSDADADADALVLASSEMVLCAQAGGDTVMMLRLGIADGVRVVLVLARDAGPLVLIRDAVPLVLARDASLLVPGVGVLHLGVTAHVSVSELCARPSPGALRLRRSAPPARRAWAVVLVLVLQGARGRLSARGDSCVCAGRFVCVSGGCPRPHVGLPHPPPRVWAVVLVLVLGARVFSFSGAWSAVGGRAFVCFRRMRFVLHGTSLCIVRALGRSCFRFLLVGVGVLHPGGTTDVSVSEVVGVSVLPTPTTTSGVGGRALSRSSFFAFSFFGRMFSFYSARSPMVGAARPGLSWADTAASTLGRMYGPRTPPLPASVSLAWLPAWVWVPGFLLVSPPAPPASIPQAKGVKAAKANGAIKANGVLIKENIRKSPRRLRLPFAPRKSTAGFLAACTTGALVALVFWAGVGASGWGGRGVSGVAEMRAVAEGNAGANAGYHSQYSIAGQYLRSEGGASLRRWVPEGVIGGLDVSMNAPGAQTTPARFGVSGWVGLVALVVFAGVVSGVAEALDLGGLDDNLTLPIISGGALMLFFRVWGWAVGAA